MIRRTSAVLVFCLMTVPVWAAESVPFVICQESRTWTRPAPHVQATIWKDPRYLGLKPENFWEWTHNFIMVPTHSASIVDTNGNIIDRIGDEQLMRFRSSKSHAGEAMR